MKKMLLLSVLFMVILTGCFEKKTLSNTGSNSEYLEITNFPSESNTDAVGNIILEDGSSLGTPIIIESSTLIPIDKIVSIRFTESINSKTVNASTAYINDPDGVPVPAQLRVVDNQINIIPNEFLLPDARYTIVITTGVKDIRGRSLEGAFIYIFPTEPVLITTPEAPTLLSISPSNGAVALPTTIVVMTFSENIMGNGTIILQDNSTNTVVNGTTSTIGNTLRFVPQTELINGTSYTVSLQGTIEDLDGNPYEGITSWRFSVEDLAIPDTTPPVITLTGANPQTLEIGSAYVELNATTDDASPVVIDSSAVDMNTAGTYNVTYNATDAAGNHAVEVIRTVSVIDSSNPSLTSLTPGVNATNVDRTINVTMVFDENIANNSARLEVRDSLNTLVVGTNSIAANTLNFNPTNDLNENEVYTVTLINTIEDLAGNAYTDTISPWSFTTGDGTRPTLISLIPYSDEIGVIKTTDIRMIFDEVIADNNATLLIKDSSNMEVNGSKRIINDTLIFEPTNDLIEGETYTVTLENNVTDLAGNIYNGIRTWSFTVNILDPFTVESVSHLGNTVVVKFSGLLDWSTSHASDFLINDGNITFNTFNNLIDSVSFTADTNLTGSELITVSGTVQNVNSTQHNNGVAATYAFDTNITNNLTVTNIKNKNGKINIELYEKLDASTITQSNILINSGNIGYSGLKVTHDKWQIEFTPDTPLDGDDNITISGSVKSELGKLHNGGVARDYKVSGILSVWDIKYSGNVITVKFWEIPGSQDKLDASTISESDFLINDGMIGFTISNVSNYNVELTADTALTGNEVITVSGDIEDLAGNKHNYGVAVSHKLR